MTYNEHQKHFHVTLSSLGHTWILDLDGTIVKHNGYKLDGEDSFLPQAREFLLGLPKDDIVVFLTSRTRDVREATEAFLKKNNIRYHAIIFDVPYGERILVNDSKPSGLQMAYCVPLQRDKFEIHYSIDHTV